MASRRSKPTATVSAPLAAVSVACVIGLVVALVLLSGSDRVSRPQTIGGDVLGPESGETLSEYSARADQSLQRATQFAESEDKSDSNPNFWALVTFPEPVNVVSAAHVVSNVQDIRVATMIIGALVTIDLPEPTAGHTREDVFRSSIQRQAASSGLSPDDPQLYTNGLLVYGSAKQLQDLRHQPGVAAVEALPHDATRGRFGVRAYLGDEPSAPFPPEEQSNQEETPQ